MLGADGSRCVAALASTGPAEGPAQARNARPGMGAERMVMTQWLTGVMWWHFGYQPRHRSTRQVTDADWLATDGWVEPLPDWEDADPAEADPADADPADADPADADPAGADPAEAELEPDANLDTEAHLDTETHLEPQASSQSHDDPRSPADESSPASQKGPDLHDHLTSDQLRHLLEGCALDDVARIVRPLVQVIAHSSHSAATLASTWGEFRKSTRDAYALHVGTCRWSDFFRREELGSYPAEDAVEMKLRQADHAWRLLTDGVR
jgi:hypothetical protein